MTTCLHDLRFSVRLLVRHPGFSIAALCVLGVGIGVVTTVVSVANGLLLRAPAVRDPATLVRVFSGRYSGTPLLDLLAYDEASTQLDGIAAFREARLSVRVGHGDVLPLFGTLVTGNYFDVVGVSAARGRTFLPAEGRTPGDGLVAVLSHRAWMRHFGGDPTAIGGPLLVNGQVVTIIGVMPASFIGLWGPVATDLWMPVTAHPLIQPGAKTFVERDAFYAQAVARLAPGTGLARAQAELDARYRQWQETSDASSERSTLRLEPLRYLVARPAVGGGTAGAQPGTRRTHRPRLLARGCADAGARSRQRGLHAGARSAVLRGPGVAHACGARRDRRERDRRGAADRIEPRLGHAQGRCPRA